MPTLNPVLLTEQATQKLPRALLLCMLLAYALSGLLGRDPWRGDDALGFGMALSIAQGEGVRALQSVAGAELAANGPLWFAIVGAFIYVLGFLPAHVAATVPVILSLLLAAYALWYATYYLAKTPAAQPLALALGGQPKPLAYARAVADGAVLLLLATLGIALRTHEISAENAHFALLSCLLMGACLYLNTQKQTAALLTMAFAMAGVAASVGLHAIGVALLWLLVLCINPAWRNLRRAFVWLLLAAVIGFAAPFGLAYLLGQVAYIDALWAWNVAEFGVIPFQRLRWLLANGAIFAWPAIPFAAVSVWRWRRYARAAHIWAGASFVAVYVSSLLLRSHVGESHLLAVLPGALILAAFLLPALPRVWMNAIDWFGVMALSAIALFVWLVWVAMSFGWPPVFAKNVLRLVPGLDTDINWLTLAVGLAVSIFWIMVVRWRVLSAKTVVWRAAVVWSAGSLTLWVLLGSLFMPWLNHTKTYRPVAMQLKTVIQDHSQCISPVRLGLPQRAVLAYFGDILFEPQPLQIITDAKAEEAPIDTPATVGCNWLLEYASLQQLSSLERLPYLPDGNWQLVWEGRRFIDKDERFRLYQRVP